MVFGATAIVCASVFLVTALAQSSPSNSQTGETFALVIGISKYLRLPGGYQLQFADKDARP